MKKKSLVLITSVMLVALLIAGGTMAWFTADTAVAANKFKAGTLKIKLWDRFDQCRAQNVNPGDCYDKEVYVINNGTKRAFVRIKKDMVFDGGQNNAVVGYTLGQNWVENDGYFYYTKELKAAYIEDFWWFNPRTTDLFVGSGICFDGAGMTNAYQGAKFTINVKAEAVQVTNGAPQAVWGVNPATLTPAVAPQNTLRVVEPEAIKGEKATEEEIKAYEEFINAPEEVEGTEY